MSLVTIDMTGIAQLRSYFDAAPEAATNAVRDAINDGIKFAFAEASRRIRAQVNLPQDYIGSVAQGNRLKVSMYATAEQLWASLSATKRAVSLARYANDRSLGRRPDGITVTVKPGHPETLPGAFLLPLKKGPALTEDTYNVGLAIRLKPGQRPGSKHTMKPYGRGDPNLYLLYGPSVDQVFRQVRGDMDDVVTNFVTQSFYRQFRRHSA